MVNWGKSKISPKDRLSGYLPPHQLAAVRKAEKAATDSNISYATSGDGASVRVGYANTSDLVSDILELSCMILYILHIRGEAR